MTPYSIMNTPMPQDNLYIKDAARIQLMAGVQRVAAAVGGTMGTGGSNAIIEAIESPGHMLTNDGYTIANAIRLANPIEDMGRKILLESINRANKASGDGSSTTCVLTAAILHDGYTYLNNNSPMEIKRSLEECIPLIEEELKKSTRYLFSNGTWGALNLQTLEQVATVSAEDESIGKRIAEIYSQIGPKGIIHWDVSKTPDDSYTIGHGITLEGAGWFTPYMCDADDNGRNTNQIRLKNPYILITQQKVSSASDFNKIAQALNAKDVRDLVVFCDDIDPLVVPDLIQTRMVRGFRIILVKMPVLWKDEWFEDLERATGAKLLNATATQLKDAALSDCGNCINMVITKDDTFLDGIADITAWVTAMEQEGSDAAKLRASRLNTSTARYFVGAHSDSALSHRRLKVEDAISAAYHALNGGIVAGGGVALRNVALALDKDPLTTGKKILLTALLVPFETILANAGIVVKAEDYTDDSTLGYDTRTGTSVDMFEEGIVDPTPIVLNAVKNAISVAASIITAQTVITYPRE